MLRKNVLRSVSIFGLATIFLTSQAVRAAEFGCLGDTVKIGGFAVNLISIDAPELGQTCLSPEGQVFQCGNLVQQMLSAKFAAAGPTGTCLVHFLTDGNEGEGFCGTFEVDPHHHVDCISQDFGGELARDGYARTGAVGEFPTSSLYWAGHQATKEKRGLFAGTILQTTPTSP